MKGLTLWQPWATLVAASVKSVETRSWGADYRGPLAIHAARKWDSDICEYIEQVRADLKRCWGQGAFLRPECQQALYETPWRDTLGCIVALVDLADCRPMLEAPDPQEALFGSFGPGRWGWTLTNVRPVLPPLPCKGARGLWDVPPEVAAAVYVSLGAGPPPAEPDLFTNVS